MPVVMVHYRCVPRRDEPHVSEVLLQTHDAQILNDLGAYFSKFYCLIAKTRYGIRLEAKKILYAGFSLLEIFNLIRQYRGVSFCLADDLLAHLEVGFKEKKRIAREAVGDFVHLSAIHKWSGQKFSEHIMQWSADSQMLCHLSGFAEFERCHLLADVLIKLQLSQKRVAQVKQLFTMTPSQVAFANFYGLWSLTHRPQTRLLRYLPLSIKPDKRMQ